MADILVKIRTGITISANLLSLSTVTYCFTLTLTMLETGRDPHDAKDFQALVT